MRRVYLFVLFSMVLSSASFAQDGRYPILQQNVPFTITNSGSYRVVQDLSPASGDGSAIIVHADDVWIDLCGHTVSGRMLFPAIYQSASNKNLTVVNGTLNGNSYGIQADGSYNRFRDLHVKSCISGGIKTGAGSMISDCAIMGMNNLLSSSSAMIDVADDCQIGGCVVCNNDSQLISRWTALKGGDGVVIHDCAVKGNTATDKLTLIDVKKSAVLSRLSCAENKCSSDKKGVYSVVSSNALIITDSTLEDLVFTELGSVIVNSIIVKSVANVSSKIVSGKGSVVADNDFGESTFDTAGVVVGNDLGSLILSGPGTLFAENLQDDYWVSIHSYSYVMDNMFDGLLSVTNDFNRIDGNNGGNSFNPYDLTGAKNFFVRNLSFNNTYDPKNADNDHTADTVEISSGAVTSGRPWANLKDTD